MAGRWELAKNTIRIKEVFYNNIYIYIIYVYVVGISVQHLKTLHLVAGGKNAIKTCISMYCKQTVSIYIIYNERRRRHAKATRVSPDVRH